MPAVQTEDAFVLQAFREFYAQVIRLRRRVLANPNGSPAAAGAFADGHAPRQDLAQRVSNDLLATLERLGLEAGRRSGEFGAAFFREAQYVMATLADEVFLQLEWEARGTWAASLLETRLFGSHAGGDLFFRRLDVLLHEQDAVKRPLVAVYLMALSLGFQGRYRGRPDAAEVLAGYRRRAFAWVFPGHRSVLDGQRKLFPDAYDHTAAGGTPVRLPHARRWVMAAAAVFLLYLFVSHRTYVGATAQVRVAADSVEATELRVQAHRGGAR